MSRREKNTTCFLAVKTEFPQKSTEDLKSLNTKNLLAYYKAVRARYGSFKNKFYCDVCLEFHIETEADKATVDECDKYLGLIKAVLNTRENVILEPKYKRTKKDKKREKKGFKQR